MSARRNARALWRQLVRSRHGAERRRLARLGLDGFDVFDIRGRPLLARISDLYCAEAAAADCRRVVERALRTAECSHIVTALDAGGRPTVTCVGDRRSILGAISTFGPQYSVALGSAKVHEVRHARAADRAVELSSAWNGATSLLVFQPVTSHHRRGLDGLDTATSVRLGDGQPGAAQRSKDIRLPRPTVEPDRPPFALDAVITWVDGNDPDWRRQLTAVRGAEGVAGGAIERFASVDEIRFSLRSIAYYAPFFRTIYLVTNGQRPAWLADHPKVQLVRHEEIFTDLDALPTFNSHAIEAHLHHIDDLAEHYVYFNDDVFIGAPITWTEYFTPDGRARFANSETRPPEQSTSLDNSTDHAVRNSVRALTVHVGPVDDRKVKHTPHPQRRSVLFELEARLPLEFDRVTRQRIRSDDDLPFATFLHHRFAEHTGRAIAVDLDHVYIDVRRHDLAARLEQLAVDRVGSFCLNDGPTAPADRQEFERIVAGFMRRRFPFAAPWEESDLDRAC